MSEHDDGNDNQDDKLKELVPDDKAEEHKDVDYFDLDACAEAFSVFLINTLNHVTPENRLPLLIQFNSMLQAKAKELSEGH